MALTIGSHRHALRRARRALARPALLAAARQEANANFIEDVKAAGFTQDSKILVCCSDGRQRSIMALMALDDAGFTNIVGLKGGANFFARIFDNKLVRRLGMEAKEVYTHSGDGCGIHGSGAAFKKVDSVLMDLGSVKDSITWIDWEEAGASRACAGGSSRGRARATAGCMRTRLAAAPLYL